MNSMKASIAGGVIHSTDYFSSRDRDEGRAWLVMHGIGWHVLPRLQRYAQHGGQARHPHRARPPPHATATALTA